MTIINPAWNTICENLFHRILDALERIARNECEFYGGFCSFGYSSCHSLFRLLCMWWLLQSKLKMGLVNYFQNQGIRFLIFKSQTMSVGDEKGGGAVVSLKSV